MKQLSFSLTIFLSALNSALAQHVQEAVAFPSLSSPAVQVSGKDWTLWLELSPEAIEKKRATIPRLCAPIRAMHWVGQPDAELKFTPEPAEWVFTWTKSPGDGRTIQIVLDAEPILLADLPPVASAGDGSILLPAHTATPHGEKLRYEPQWFKNTVGYWAVPTDYVTWSLHVDQPGTFSVAILQGCGAGQGGSDAKLSMRSGDAGAVELPFQVLETGHFQNFRWNHLGKIRLEAAGDYELRIEAVKVAKNALVDIRAVHLVRQANDAN